MPPKSVQKQPANLDPDVEIKVTDKDFVHVRHTRIITDETGKHPTRVNRIQVYSPNDWDGMQRWIDEHGTGSLNDDEVEVVHDPRREKMTKEQRDAADKKAADEAKAAEAEKKEKEKILKEAKEKAEFEETVARIEALIDQNDLPTAERLIKNTKGVPTRVVNALKKAKEAK